MSGYHDRWMAAEEGDEKILREADEAIQLATQALRWIADHERDPDAIREAGACENRFHWTRQEREARCPDCCSRWWDLNEGMAGVEHEGDYTLGAVAAKALAMLRGTTSGTRNEEHA